VKFFKSTLLVMTLVMASSAFAGSTPSGKLPVGKRIGESVLYCGPGGIIVTAGAAAGTVAMAAVGPFFILGADIDAGRLPSAKDLGDYKDILKEPLSDIQSIWQDCGKVAIHGEDADN